VKALRSENGGEFISGKFKDFCSTEGILLDISPSKRRMNPEATWPDYRLCLKK